MNNIHRNIFKAIHEGKWLKIEYQNIENQITSYWIGIRDLNITSRTLSVDGLHTGKYALGAYDRIYIDSILSSEVIEGSYCEINEGLVRDIYLHPHKYKSLFDHVANLKILNYLEMCNRMDTVPYYSDFELIRYLDRDTFQEECYELSDEQFRLIVKYFQLKTEEKRPDGRLRLDVKRQVLRPDEDITICTEYTVDGTVENILSPTFRVPREQARLIPFSIPF